MPRRTVAANDLKLRELAANWRRCRPAVFVSLYFQAINESTQWRI